MWTIYGVLSRRRACRVKCMEQMNSIDVVSFTAAIISMRSHWHENSFVWVSYAWKMLFSNNRTSNESIYRLLLALVKTSFKVQALCQCMHQFHFRDTIFEREALGIFSGKDRSWNRDLKKIRSTGASFSLWANSFIRMAFPRYTRACRNSPSCFVGQAWSSGSSSFKYRRIDFLVHIEQEWKIPIG